MCTGNCTEGSSRIGIFNEVEDSNEDHGAREARSARRAQCIPPSPQNLIFVFWRHLDTGHPGAGYCYCISDRDWDCYTKGYSNWRLGSG